MFDTHAHYNNARFDAEREGGADALLSSLFSEGVAGIVNVGWDVESSLAACRQAAKYPGRMFAAVGVHPCDAQKCLSPEQTERELEELLARRGEFPIVAVGEIGFDYHYPDTDKAVQAVYFDLQMEIARRHGLPVIIHDREAHGDCIAMVRRHPGVRGVFHSFSGSAETARELVSLGWYVSFSGTVTFKNAPKVREAAAAVPSDRLLAETDCPYLAPHPHRGELNHSGLMRFTLAALADCRGATPEETERLTEENARRFFSL